MKTSRLAILVAISALMMTGCNLTQKSGENSGKDSQKTSESQPTSQSESTPSSSSEADVGPVIKEPTEITIWTTYNDTYQTIINNAIEEFCAVETNVTVKNIKQQGSYDDLATMVVNGFAVDNYPDMVCAYPDAVANFINSAKSLDMDPYMNDPEIGWTEEDFDDIPEAYIALGQNYTIPGTYSLPASKSTEAMYYNQDVLIGLNLSGIDPTINDGKPLNDDYFQNMTWEELFEKLVPALDAYDQAQPEGAKIIDRTSFTDWAWVGYDSDDNLFITLAEQYGYGYTSIDPITGKGQLDFNNDGMKELMKKFKGYNDKHYFTTKGVINTNVNYRSTVDAMLFSIGSTGGVKYQFAESTKHNVGVAPIPYAAEGRRKVISQGPDFAFLDHEDENRAKAIWLFFKLFTNTKYNCAWALQTGYSPIRYSVMETTDYLAYQDVESQEEHTIDRLYALNARYAASVGKYAFSSPVFKGSATARTEVGKIFAKCVSAGDNLNAQIDSIFQEAINNTTLKM